MGLRRMSVELVGQHGPPAPAGACWRFSTVEVSSVCERAYYMMADFRPLGRGDDDMAFAYRLIDETDVGTEPESSFRSSDP